jgi:hypothetical protein
VVWLGGRVVTERRSVVEARVPIDRVGELTAEPSVGFVFVPPSPVPDSGRVESEGVSEAIESWHESGFDGSGIRVLVLDSGFGGLRLLQLKGELPTDLGGVGVGPTCSGGIEGGGSHGAATSEIVHDVAPGAQLFLYRTCYLTFSESDAILEFIRDHEIDVVTQSLGYYNTGPLDGSDPVGLFRHVTEALDDGVVWFNSVGNQREGHWRGTWSGDRKLEFSPGEKVIETFIPAGSGVFLRWDDWRLPTDFCDACSTDIDLDLVVKSTSGVTLGKSSTPQNELDPWLPIEGGWVSVSGTYGIQVKAVGDGEIPEDLVIDLLFTAAVVPTELQVPEGSLNDVAAIPGVTAVGAVSCADGEIRYYSSQGPTTDGRTKPDIVAPDGVATATYGSGCEDGFQGTSASAPHAAGLAALIMQATGARGPDVTELLAKRALPGPPGEGDLYGAGVVEIGDFRVGTCRGLEATIVALPGQTLIVGTAGPDVIRANGANNIIRALGGDDIVCAKKGKDIVEGGDGDDVLIGNAGADTLEGGKGSDVLKAGKGDDFLDGGKGSDKLVGGKGTDQCVDGEILKTCEA